MDEQNRPLTALVFGASGITGWAIAQQALVYPTSTTFRRVIGLTNRPLTKFEALLPSDERLQLYSGINLSSNPSEIEAMMKNIPEIKTVTHVYFTGRYLTMVPENL